MDDQQLQTVITMLMGALDTALSRITNLEARLAALENPPYPDDVRDALAALDELRGDESLWKLRNFPADRDGIACWPPFDPDKPDQTLFMWRVNDEDGE